MASDVLALNAKIDSENKATRDHIVGPRRAVIGRGILIGEIEARMRRLEQHLDPPSMDARISTPGAGP